MIRRVLVATIVVALLALSACTSNASSSPTCQRVKKGAPLEAWLNLLECNRHPITTRRTLRDIPQRATAFVTLPGSQVDAKGIDQLNAVIRSGGRVVIVGEPQSWAAQLGAQPDLFPGDPASTYTSATASPVTRGVETVTTNGAVALATDTDGALMSSDRRGTLLAAPTTNLFFLADVAVFDSAHLDRADSALLAVNLAGPEGRPAVFVAENRTTIPGGFDLAATANAVSDNTGLSALPFGWKFALSGLAVAALLLAIARGRRLGPPERSDRALPPRRAAFVDAVGASLARTRDPAGAGSTLHAHARARLHAMAGLPDDASADAFGRAARAMGLTDADIAALERESANEQDLIRTAQVVAKLEGTRS